MGRRALPLLLLLATALGACRDGESDSPDGSVADAGPMDPEICDNGVDAMGRRVARFVDGAFDRGWLYVDALNPIAELAADGSVRAVFVYGTKPHVPDLMLAGGRTYRFVVDHLGSVRRVVDVDSGDVAQALDYDAFGRVLRDTRPGFQPFGFAGGLWDADAGLVRFGARDYDPELGRWTARDPILFAGGQPNLYEYAGSDPVNRIDPSGLLAFLGPALISGGIGAIIGYLTADECSRASGAIVGFMTGFGVGLAAPAAAAAFTVQEAGTGIVASTLGTSARSVASAITWETTAYRFAGGALGAAYGNGIGQVAAQRFEGRTHPRIDLGELGTAAAFGGLGGVISGSASAAALQGEATRTVGIVTSSAMSLPVSIFESVATQAASDSSRSGGMGGGCGCP